MRLASDGALSWLLAASNSDRAASCTWRSSRSSLPGAVAGHCCSAAGGATVNLMLVARRHEA